LTAVCGGGASQPKNGVVGEITASVEAVAAILALAGIELPALLVALIGAGIRFAAPQFCGVDPPVDPQPTQQDLVDALNMGDPLRQFAAVAKYQQWFLSRYWYQICECVSASTPTPPALSPPGSSTTNPYLPTGSNQPCFSNSYTDTYPVQGAAATIHELTPQLLPASGTPITVQIVTGNTVHTNQRAWPIPSGVTGVDVHAATLQKDAALSATAGLNVKWSTFTADSASVGQLSLLQANTQNLVDTHLRVGQTSVWPQAATHYAIHSGSETAAGANTVQQLATLDTTGICTGSPLEQACCPPDPSIDARLNQIIAYLTYLINHPATATAAKWKDGVRHTGLTGQGRLVFTGPAIGVRIEVTDMPPVPHVDPGNPNFYWDLAFLTPIALDVPLRGYRVVFNPESFALPSQADGISWTLKQARRFDLVELVPV
jgi:hypothetical protein